MIEIKKLEDKEVVFVNEKPTKKEDLEFSKFLKERKSNKSNPRKRIEKNNA